MSAPTVSIDPIAKGRITPQALLHSEGTITLPLIDEFFNLPSPSAIFHIAGENFCFGLGFVKGKLMMQRNQYVLEADRDFLFQLKGNNVVLASWTLERLRFLLGDIGFVGPSIHRTVHMSPIPAPLSLIKWARSESLLPVKEFESESDFLGRVHSSLDLIQTKIDQMHNRNAFWDIEYQGNKIVSRKPKREVDLHPVIQALLSDQMFLSSIEIATEVRTGVGNLDFVFMGSVKGRGIVKICAEFKVAHSGDLIRGIEHQLPAYMSNQQTQHGTYCVIDFRGEWFNEPRLSDEEMTVRLAEAGRRGISNDNAIKVHRFAVGKQSPASER